MLLRLTDDCGDNTERDTINQAAGRWHGEERVYPCEPAGMLGGRWVGIPREWLEGHYMAVWCQYLISGA